MNGVKNPKTNNVKFMEFVDKLPETFYIFLSLK